MWCTLGSTRTITWISKCGGLMTLLQPSCPLCYQGSSAAFISLGGQRYPKGLHLPRQKRACGVMVELLLGQMYPAPHTLAGPWPEGNKLLEQGGIDLDATISAFTPEDTAAVIISDDDETSFPAGWPEAVSTPIIELALGQKQPSEDRSPCSSPPKKRATEKKEESPPLHEAALPRGVSEEDILPKRYEVFTSDYDWVQSIRGSFLGLEAGTSPSRRDIDNSSHFIPRMAESESDLPEVITEHWLPILRREGLLVECPPDQFTAPADWIPLYTREGLQKYLPAALSAFPSLGALSLIAIAPSEFCVGTDKEFLLCDFHCHQCLVRQSFNLKGSAGNSLSVPTAELLMRTPTWLSAT